VQGFAQTAAHAIIQSRQRMLDRYESQWNCAYDLLKDYYIDHEDSDVPKKVKFLGQWAADQRQYFKRWNAGELSSMTSERVRKLK
jgi:hypothetical protein